ncbi:helix-turn-helix domain-containing protein [Fusibacter ferrireducens]|uniref:Helix-turn-helix transcriptional regulator n=1 Tax=Fusibacter ferrireducens TaxID=2785058 RepID=A0ABR9ZUN1_9FIRM|nr:XRE family transcriptional regulator [Fusibacter ferrireducens]MBF4694177.1 helix-turn-helix transcriptional regulator [Fusibacter ferrireducens]
MIPMNLIIASNVKKNREALKLSMEELARLSGVSKSMLAQIERGEGNPTITTLWKIANGMQVTFDTLTMSPKRDFEIIKTSEIEPILEDGGRVRTYIIFPDNENRKFAIYCMEIDPGGYWHSDPHLRGSSEFITVHNGQLTICASEQAYTVQQGESIRFESDVAHSYHNTGEAQVLFHMVLYNY